MNYILGSGLVGLLARDILGPSWKLIPFGKSRFFTFKPALTEEWIVRDEAIEYYISQFSAIVPIYIKNSYTIAGQLTNNHAIAQESWLRMVYGDSQPNHADHYWKTHMEYWAYTHPDGLCSTIYRTLQQRYIKEIKEGLELGKPTAITDKTIVTGNTTIEYDKIISAVPLQVLMQLTGAKSDLPGRDLWAWHVRSDSLNFEGASSLFVCDDTFGGIFRSIMLDRLNYLFMGTKPIAQPGMLFMQFIERFELVGETSIAQAIPCGEPPADDAFSGHSIKRIGATSAWDHCIDIGTVIKRLVKMKNA